MVVSLLEEVIIYNLNEEERIWLLNQLSKVYYNYKSKSKYNNMNNNNKNKRIVVCKKIIYWKSNFSYILDMQSFFFYNGIFSKFLEKFCLLEIFLMMNF